MSITLSVAVERYLNSKKLTSGTCKEYRATVTKWLAWGKGVDLDEIERSHIREFLDWVYDMAKQDGGYERGAYREQITRESESDYVVGLGT